MNPPNPEIGLSIKTGAFNSNYHDTGRGNPLLLIHGSGPGVSSWANWGRVLPGLSQRCRVLALDVVGFGFTDRLAGLHYNLDTWIRQAVDFLDALEIEQTDLVGNSFGGALALALTILYPHRVRRLVLMGAMGVSFPLTHGLDKAWGYTPSLENMRALLDLFAYDRKIVTDDLAQMRYLASIRPGFQESFVSMFPAPRQNGIEELARYQQRIPEIRHPTLILHGREDQVIPMENALKLFRLIPNAQLHLFGRCGHWTQIEHAARFVRLVDDFLAE